MRHNLLLRFTVILVTVVFLGVMAYQGVAQGGLELGIDLKGGTELVFQFEFEGVSAKQETLQQAVGVIQQRIDGFGMKDIAIQPIGDRGFAVQISATDKDKVDAVKDIITQLGKLEFRITVEPGANDNYQGYWTLFQDALKKGIPPERAALIRPDDLKPEDKNRFPEGLRWYPLSPEQRTEYSAARLPRNDEGRAQPWVLCELDLENVSGDDLANVRHGIDQSGVGTSHAVYFEVRKLAQPRMASLTEFEESKFMAIILNEEVNSAPVLKSTLSDRGQITGGFTEQKARQLAAVLQAGALQEKPTLVSERTIAPDLAGDARDRGILSIALAFAVVLGVMLWLYLAPGLLANLALLLNLVLLLGVLTWFDAVLTLPGMAGIILTVGMAVDANILVYERMKEELARGRTVAQAIGLGYDRALVTIIDANVTTLITAYFLFQIGSGPVRGFGITLAVGIVASMFTALYVTRSVFELLLRRKALRELKMRGTPTVPTVSWTSLMRGAVTGSAIAMVAGVLLWEGAPDKVRYDLDFTQGSKLIMRFNEPLPSAEVRAKIADAADRNRLYGDIAVRATAEGIGQEIRGDESRAFELRSQNIAADAQIEEFKTALREMFSGKLLAGPLDATLRPAAGGGVEGEIHFLSDRVKAEMLEAAFLQFADAKNALVGAQVTPVPPSPGAGASFRLVFPQDQNEKAVVFNVGTALADFDLAKAKTRLQEIATAETSTPSEQENAARLKAAIDTLSAADMAARIFEECDPFPLADLINPSTAQEHRDAAVQAIGLSILGIVIYVAFRFRAWSYGFAAVVALIHDVLLTLGVVAIVNWLGIFDARLNLVTVAAFLTLIGYSINDTIVVFDRIRENRGASGRARLGEIIDQSVNQTLARTIRTSATTWIVVLILLVLNYGANSALEGFAFILTFGILVGTYSSIFIAAPTLLYLPWLWEKSGSTVKSLVKRVVPYGVAAAVLLIVNSYLHAPEEFTREWSVPVFNGILLAVPVGVLAFFLVNFVRFVRSEAATATTA